MESEEDEKMNSINIIIKANFSPIESAFHDDEITDICIDSYKKIVLYKNSEQILTDLKFTSDLSLQTALQILSNTLGQEGFDQYHPVLNAKMPDGSRVAALHSISSPNGTSATIRLHRPFKFTIDDYVNLGTIKPETKDYLLEAVRNKKNILISGSTGSWKTSLINVLAENIPDSERVLVCEDTTELILNKKSTVSFEAPVREKKDDMDIVELPDLILHTLRYRPDRIIVGEIRDAQAAAAAYRTLTSGHDGFLSSVHARTCESAFNLIAGYTVSCWGGVPYEIITKALMESLDIIVHMKKHDVNKKLRYIDEMVEVSHNGFKQIIKPH